MGRPKISEEPRVATAVRLPESVHRQLTLAASERDVSVNLLVTHAVTAYLDRLPSPEAALSEPAATRSRPSSRTVGRRETRS